MGYRALVQTEDHLLLFLQQLGEWTSSTHFFFRPAHEFHSDSLFGAVDRLLRKVQVECILNIFFQSHRSPAFENFLSILGRQNFPHLTS